MKTIAFVREYPSIRIYKLAKALKHSTNYKLVLICRTLSYDAKLFEDLFDQIYFFTPEIKLNKQLDLSFNKWWNKKLKFGYKKVLKILDKVNPTLIHTMAEPYNIIAYLLKNSEYPLILDANDFTGISSGLENLDKETLKLERFCLENANGVAHKGPDSEINYYREHGYKINCPEMTWLNYCDIDLFNQSPSERLSKSDNEIHLVYTGLISNDPSLKYIYFLPLAEKFTAQKIHFHIYPKFANTRLSYEAHHAYIDFSKNEKYFHFHKPLSLNELVNEISVYDWGLWIHSEDPSLRTHPEKIKIGSGNKIFSYLEAGIPMIVSSSRVYGKKIVEEHGIGFGIADKEWDEFDQQIKAKDYSQFKNNVMSVREKLSLQNQGTRLKLFYDEIIKNQMKRRDDNSASRS